MEATLPVTLAHTPITQQLAIKAYLESGMSIKQTARLAKVSPTTVIVVKRLTSLNPDSVDRIKKLLAAKFYSVTDRSLDAITDEKLKKSSASQLIMVAAVGTDKARLIEGKATSRTEYVDAADKAIEEEIGTLEQELAELGANGEVVESTGSEAMPTIPEGQPAPSTVERV